MADEKKDKKLSNMSWSTLTEDVAWPFAIGKGKVVQVSVIVAVNAKLIKQHHEIRVWTPPTTGKKRKTMEVVVGDI